MYNSSKKHPVHYAKRNVDLKYLKWLWVWLKTVYHDIYQCLEYEQLEKKYNKNCQL